MIDEIIEGMIRRQDSREARDRAAAALLSYVGNPCPATECSLLEAAHELEAFAALRRLRRVSQRRRAGAIRQLVAH